MRKITKESTLKFIGRGSMFNVKEGNTSAYWKNEKGDTMILIDCGCTVFQRIIELDLLKGVHTLRVLITHTHTDHVGSLADLAFYCEYATTDLYMSIYSPTKNKRVIRGYLESVGSLNMIENSCKINLYCLDSYFDTHRWLYEFRFVEDITHQVESYTYGSNSIGGGINCYNHGIFLNLKDNGVAKIIYYSGDTQKIPYDISVIYREVGIDEIYVDCAVRTKSPGSDNKYPHYNLYEMCKDMKRIGIPVSNVYAMHIDCDGVFDECKQFGINVVENV